MKYADIGLLANTHVRHLPLSLENKAVIEELVAQHGSPLLLLDCQVLRQQYQLLKHALPNVTLHFALKPLPHDVVVKTLLNEGASFDLASNGEVDMVRRQGVDPNSTIHTHPIKRDSDIRYAMEYGCTRFVIDGVNELRKFIPYKDQVQLFLRLSFPNADVFSDLSKKFGCNVDAAISILQQANDLGIRISGISFHVGSQTMDPQRYVYAIGRCLEVIENAQQAGLPDITTLDIGGGFPVSYGEEDLNIHEYCAPIREALNKVPNKIALLAEPGRFIVGPAVMSVASVMGQAIRSGKPWYYLDDGVYGSFSGILFDHGHYPIDVFNAEAPRVESVLAGPTCDSIDVIDEAIMLPKLNDGDLIVTRMMGAYTSATATEFNFFKKANIVALNE
ncbi:MAG: type III PLP-dependent enzyme [Gammaproteobacteria bacterium]|nr:type III PLP-dependent enzyme [Gammaproteobacteria bacterium]